MKNPKFQNQHKLPQVYMRQFGYKYKNQWKVSVIKKDEKYTRQKSIESFLSEINIFKIKNQTESIENIFEKLNGMIENEYLNFLNDLETQKKLSEKSIFILFQFISNLICRTDAIRDLVKKIIDSDSKINFIKMICIDNLKSVEDLENQKFYKGIINEPLTENVINLCLIFLSRHLQLKLIQYEVVILKSQDEKPWFTSDNPIIFENKIGKFDILMKESEIYFPLNPKFLIYLHNKKSADKNNQLRFLEANKIHAVNDVQNTGLQHKIISNAIEYIIIEGEFKHIIK